MQDNDKLTFTDCVNKNVVLYIYAYLPTFSGFHSFLHEGSSETKENLCLSIARNICSQNCVFMVPSTHTSFLTRLYYFCCVLHFPVTSLPSSPSPFHPLPLPRTEDGARESHPRPTTPPDQSGAVVCLPRPPLGWWAARRGRGTCVITEAT